MPYVQGDMKNLNRRAVFDLISDVGEISRVEISNQLGISVPTVLKITKFMLDRGIVTLKGEEKTARGRRPQLLRFNPDSILGIGVDYDCHTVKASVCNYWGEQKAIISEPTDHDLDVLMQETLPVLLERLLSEHHIEKEYIYSVGICLPGAVDTANANVQFGALSGIHFKRTPAENTKILSERLGKPVYLFNDVNAGAKGEYVLRRQWGDDLVYLSAGDGIGAGIILDGKLRTGKHFYSGEVAHIVFDPEFITDISRPGWMEAKVSMQTLHEKFPDVPDSGNEEMICYVAQYLALAVANICNVLDVQTVILDGLLVKNMGKALTEKTAEYAGNLCMFDVHLAGPSCENPSLVGTASMALELELDTILPDNVM